jgi:ABC-2 type transport system permease protein/oleandomycin transport system permease protein
MSTATASVITQAPPMVARPQRGAFRWAVSDALTVCWRNLVAMTRQPQVLVFSTIQPIIFVIMFRYVFGGAITIPGVPHYVDYLMAGVFAQTVVFGSVQTGVGLSEDLHKGLIERFRSLPMARSAVLAGRTLADLVRNVFVVGIMVAVGFLVGWRVHTSIFAVLAGIGVLLLFGHSLNWLFALVGLNASSAEAAQAMAFPIMAPLVFVSTAFVSASTMPGPLKWFAEHQPVSIVVDAVRSLTYGGQFSEPGKVLAAILWSVAIIAVCAPLAVRTYRRKA